MKRLVPSAQQAAVLRLLARRRLESGLSQAALAARLGLTQSEVSKFERGERCLELLQLRAWLEALGSSLPAFAEALEHELSRIGPVRPPAGEGVARSISP